MYIFEAVCVIFTLCGLEKSKIKICAPISLFCFFVCFWGFFLGIKDENEIIKNHTITITFTLCLPLTESVTVCWENAHRFP